MQNITPTQSARFTEQSIREISTILKKRFNNLTVEETIQIAAEIATMEHSLMLKIIVLETED